MAWHGMASLWERAQPRLLFLSLHEKWTQSSKHLTAATESLKNLCWKGGWVVSFTTSLGNLFLFFSPPMGNFFPSSVVNDCCILSSYPAFQDRAWLYFLSSLVRIVGFYQFTQKLALQAKQAHLPQFLLTGQSAADSWSSWWPPLDAQVYQHFLALGGAKLDALSPGFLSSFLQKLHTGSFLRLKNGNMEHVTGLSTKVIPRSLSVLTLLSFYCSPIFILAPGNGILCTVTWCRDISSLPAK